MIKVERKSDDESDIMSEVSEGGWIGKDDERNRERAMKNKTLWKIMDHEKKEEEEESDL